MHLVWISDSPTTPSGFGNVSRYVCQGLAERGHKVTIVGWQARSPSTWNGCQVIPAGSDPWGSDVLFSYLVRRRPDAVVALADIWWLPFFTAPHVRRQMELLDAPWILYFPVDGNSGDGTLPPSWIEMLREVDVPIAMSRYGERIAKACGVDCEYIPHGVDLDTFHPPADRTLAKATVNAQDRFLVLSDSRNQPRKMLPRLLDIFSGFVKNHPDALLHLHTDPDDDFARSSYYSYDLRSDIAQLGLQDHVRFSAGFRMQDGEGLSIEDLAKLYQAADVHLLASSGEGFGLPTLQAAAAGAVPMAGAYSASQELVEGHGEAVPIGDWTETEFGIRRALIDVSEAIARLGRLYSDPALLAEKSRRSREFALQYGWPTVVEMWHRLLTSLARQPVRRRDRPENEAGVARTIERVLPTPDGVRVTVRMVAREAGRLESSIAADAAAHDSDVRIPALPAPFHLEGLRVPRRQGYLGLARMDVRLYLKLRRIFPSLHAWTPSRPVGPGTPFAPGLEVMRFETAGDHLLHLARTTVLLNVSGMLPEELLRDAAYFGVLCIGRPGPAQSVYWPDLVVDDSTRAMQLARELLTNAGLIRRLSDAARRAAPARDPGLVASQLRALHAASRLLATG